MQTFEHLSEEPVDDIFVINDIALKIPPSAIQIHTEDLLYNWKTPRTKVTTKIPTGHGQPRITLTAYFTNDMLLDLHRLVVELSNTPFCSISNAYLRESIVPEWPDGQVMAFCMTSLNIAPVPGLSDTKVLELDLTWFNYFPYSHNFTYRKDWQTNFVSVPGSNDKVKFSIGWELNEKDYTRTFRPSITEFSNTENKNVSWSALKNQFDSYDKKTIYELEREHFGETIDLLPLPGNMEPAYYVTDARASRIYTRYINLLQRDALIHNFGFNPETLIQSDHDAFFSVVRTEKGLETFGLHSDRVPSNIRSEWINKMLKYDSGVKFKYHLYKDIRLPTEWTNVLRNSNMLNSLQSVKPDALQGSVTAFQPVTEFGEKKGEPITVRNGFWSPVGKYSPIASPWSNGQPANIEDLLKMVTARVSLRSAAKDAKLYENDSIRKQQTNGSRLHKGTDFGAAVGTPIFAIAPGYISSVIDSTTQRGLRWEWVDVSGPVVKRGLVVGSSYYDEWLAAFDERNFNLQFNSWESNQAKQTVGTYFKSRTSNIWFIAGYGTGGRAIYIKHDDGSVSKYMHVKDIDLTTGTRVEAGDRIGTSGRSSTYQNEYLQAFFNKQNKNIEQEILAKEQILYHNPEEAEWPDENNPQDDSPYSLRPHLHFEYHENASLEEPYTGQKTLGMASIDTGAGLVLVDPYFSWEATIKKDRPVILPVSYDKQVDASQQDAIQNEAIPEEDAEGIANLLKSLNDNGWVYYEKDSSITNLWYKQIDIDVINELTPGPEFTDSTAILANVSGGFRNIVANLPILSHEYPTQQFLGSIEPIYNVEFTLRDDTPSLSGISEKGQQLQIMRSTLQSNARKFRPIMDAWCVTTDTFITRLLGSYKHNDVEYLPISEKGFSRPSGLNKTNLTKRFSIARSAANTVPGHPGVSTLSFEIQETNPFFFENLAPKAIKFQDKEAARKKVLNALYNLDFLSDDELAQLLLLLDEKNTKNGYNKTQITVLKDPQISSNPVALLKDNNALTQQILSKIQNTENGQLLKNIPGYDGYIGVPLDVFSLEESIPVIEIKQSPVNETAQEVIYEFDLSSTIVANALKDLDISVVSSYWIQLNDIKRYGEKTLAEHSDKGFNIEYTKDTYFDSSTNTANGLPDDEISAQLYDLPFEAKMWRSWQHYFKSYVQYQAGQSGVEAILNDRTWLVWKEDLNESLYDYRVNKENTSLYEYASGKHLGNVLSQGNQFLNFNNISDVVNSFTGDTEAIRRASCRRFTNLYLNVFAFYQKNEILLDSYSYNNTFGFLLGNDPELQKPRAFERFTDYLNESIANSGYMAIANVTGNAYFQIPDLEKDTAVPHVGKQLFFGINPAVNLVANREEANKFTKVGFTWIVNLDIEKQKVQYIKEQLAALADEILNNPFALESLQLTELHDVVQKGNLTNQDCYPDIVLPFHPYFGDTLSVDPDFYMWSLYEDGKAYSEDVQKQIENNVNQIIDNCYTSMQRLQGGIEIDPKVNLQDNLLLEPSIDSSEDLQITVKFAAEGTDQGEYGPASSPYYPVATAKDGEKKFYQDLKSYNENKVSLAENLTKNNAQEKTQNISKLELTKADIKLSNTEGYVTAGSSPNPQYPRKASAATYEELKSKLDNITAMFGSKDGQQEENLLDNSAGLWNRLTGSKLSRVDEYAHNFDPNSLKQLAKDSSKDLFSQRLTMKRAYPTFKLYIVEEDEFENVRLDFDDFHSYNGVQSFFVEMSKSNPADHAVITLQNVSGTLDGTRRDAVVDLDYFTNKKSQDNPNATSLTNETLTRDTDLDQPFNSVALRPGVNVQLRCGYSNDPDNLSVLLSGRVVDLQWNKNGDMAEIMVQSFGTQLIQAIKGTQRNGDSSVYYTTHQLLGSLMMEPELTHFGRWEIGKLFQIGESKDIRLDFYDYHKDSWIGKMSYARKLVNWAYEHPLYATGAVTTGVFFGLSSIADFQTRGQLDIVTNSVLGPLQRFFTASQVSLFLSPQDDNLYPPHPKDYMLIEQPFWQTTADALAGSAVSLLGEDTFSGSTVATTYRWLNGSRLLWQKKVSAIAAEYELLSTNIWKVFHEMSLRHPGWIYGPRPYGNEFRYTMFFGVPSQRYWARGASNQFIKRANDLSRYLEKSEDISISQLEFEYKKLYGQQSFDELNFEDVFKKPNFKMPTSDNNSPLLDSDYARYKNAVRNLTNNLKDGANALLDISSKWLTQSAQYDINQQESREAKSYKYKVLTAPAIKEYLRALNLRFVPFRRYHLFTSERNLMWNGLISAENAVVNAVDVTYFNEYLSTDQPAASALFKAHSFIPENQLRIAPVRWPNCKGYNMAMRYGMGELIHRMKNMYRGEILITGNARVRPWDVGILVDSYNDMVGPIEVDQIVHSFSHQTGFITEIKPSALVIGNEISSYPMIQAAQTFALAVIDIENSYTALKGKTVISADDQNTNAGFIGDLAKVIAYWTDDEVKGVLRRKNEQLFKKGLTLKDIAFGGYEPNEEVVNTILKDTNAVTRIAKPNNEGGELSDLALYMLNFPLHGIFNAALIGNAQKQVRYNLNQALEKGLGVSPTLDFPGLAWLLGGPILFLQCLRQDSIVVVPVLKSGTPIISGLSFNDPTMLWSNFRGDLQQFINDTLDGTKDLVSEYKQFGSYIWNNIDLKNLHPDRKALVQRLDLTGENLVQR